MPPAALPGAGGASSMSLPSGLPSWTNLPVSSRLLRALCLAPGGTLICGVRRGGFDTGGGGNDPFSTLKTRDLHGFHAAYLTIFSRVSPVSAGAGSALNFRK
ncbi:hypothetical protein AAL_05579 [Moelleriella libera RCEF 2490]|uniref:Uncharacterized protein n=1 Tax=Moelleriella libera RCEF 2490 TaxID=1081109 RepID=A0A162IIA2_9HYPO|nr:hypothetical protein AAL_05579 [Moelleriella libera RCEF 2490]